jgi:membrane protease YdiL (CAAX protease family)
VAPAARYLVETSLLTATLGVVLWRHGVSLAALGLQPDVPLGLLRDLAICLGVVVALDAWSLWRITRRIRRTRAVLPPGGLFADTLAAGRAAPSFIAVSLVGAIWEELCFRATVFQLVPHTGVGLLVGVVGGSIVFGAQHLRNGRAGFVYTTSFGVMFSSLYLATGDLVAVIVAHAAGNILAAVQWGPRIERARRESLRQAPLFLG